jgi:hypothetical protein
MSTNLFRACSPGAGVRCAKRHFPLAAGGYVPHCTRPEKITSTGCGPPAFLAIDLALDQHVMSLTCRGFQAAISICEGLK